MAGSALFVSAAAFAVSLNVRPRLGAGSVKQCIVDGYNDEDCTGSVRPAFPPLAAPLPVPMAAARCGRAGRLARCTPATQRPVACGRRRRPAGRR